MRYTSRHTSALGRGIRGFECPSRLAPLISPRCQSTSTSSTHGEAAVAETEQTPISDEPFKSTTVSTPLLTTPQEEGTSAHGQKGAQVSRSDPSVLEVPKLSHVTEEITTPASHGSASSENKNTATVTAKTSDWPTLLRPKTTLSDPKRKPINFKPVVTDRFTRAPANPTPIRKVSSTYTTPPLKDRTTHPRYRALAKLGYQPQDSDATAVPAANGSPSPAPPLLRQSSPPAWVHMTNLPDHTTKTDIVTYIMAAAPVGRIVGMTLLPKGVAIVEFASRKEAEALLQFARESTVTRGIGAVLRMEVRDSGASASTIASTGTVVVAPPAVAQRDGPDRPSRVLKIVAKGWLTEMTTVDRIRAYLRAQGVDDEVEFVRVRRAGPREGNMRLWKIVMRFCCWRNQAGPALAVLRLQPGFTVYYATDPCEVGMDAVMKFGEKGVEGEGGGGGGFS